MKKGLAIVICSLCVLSTVGTAGAFVLQANGIVDFTIGDVKVEFRNYDNTFLYATRIPRGGTAEYEGETPYREGNETIQYEFVSWDKVLSNVQQDTIFYAQFQTKVKEFKVTFQNYNTKQLYSEYVQSGCAAQYIGATPTRPSDHEYVYVFSGWDKDFSYIEEDTVVTAVYDAVSAEYSVTFLNYDDTVLYIDYTVYGQSALYQGIDPVRPGNDKIYYKFKGWDKDFSHVLKDIEVHAVYDEVPVDLKAEFYNYDSTLLYTDYLGYGEVPQFVGNVPTREKDSVYRYVFKGWNVPVKAITKNTVYVAQYDQIEITPKVDYYNWDDTLLYRDQVRCGMPSIYQGKTPTREPDEYYTYTFTGWDRDLSKISDDIDTYAMYERELRKYTCSFVNYDGELLYETEVYAGDSVAYIGPTPVKNTDIYSIFKFIGWDNDTKVILDDTVFTAQFEEITEGGGGYTKYYFVSFYDYNADFDSKPLDYDYVEKGGKAIYDGVPEIPYRPPENGYTYEFYEWSDPIKNITKDTIVFAQYTAKDVFGNLYYIVSYRNKQDILIYEDYVLVNDNVLTSSYKGEMYDYLLPQEGFMGWDGDLFDIVGSTTIRPAKKTFK